MASNASKIAGWGSNQWPSFDEDWHYVGPLARCECVISKASVKKNNHESFATTGASQYPPAMDQALAEALLDDLMADSLAILSLEEGFGNMAKEQKQHEERGEKEQGEGMEQSNNEQKQSEGGPIVEKRGPTLEEAVDMGSWRNQPMMKAYYKGKRRLIHDGGGLGRICLKEKGAMLATRVKKTFLTWMARAESGEKGSVSKRFWQLASGQHPASPFTEYMDEARAEIDKELRGMGMTPERKASDRVTEINFRRMMSMLEAVEDEDAEFLEAMVARGVTLGVDEEMPRTPKVFEEKLKWSRDFVDYMLAEQFSSNYKSAVENQKDIKRQVFRRAPYFAFLRKKPGGDSKGGWQWQPWVQCLRSWARRR